MMMTFILGQLLFILALINFSEQLSLLCLDGQIPEELASVSVWQKTAPNNLTVFRIGSDELSNDGYQRSAYDRSLFVVLLGRGTSQRCPMTTCAMRLSTNQNSNDGNILHQENVFGVPLGYTEVNNPESFFCVRVEGDCGADVPLFRYANVTALNPRFAYSLDPNASIPGFVREPTPLCFGWADGGSQRVASSLKVTGCKKLTVPENGKVSYQPDDTDEYAMGSSATLTCDNGYTSTGPTELICSHTGWYPNEAFELCQADSTIQRSEVRCPSLLLPLYGSIEYSKNGTDTYSAGTIAQLKCISGYAPQNGTLQAECQINGHWTVENLGRCVQLCQALSSIPNGQLNYSTEAVEEQKYIGGTSADLHCASGYTISGQQSVTCESSRWVPFPGIGTCIPASDQCLFGLPVVLGGSITYSQQSGIFGPFVAGTQANLTCSPTLQVQGDNVSVCQNSTWNPPALGVCIPIISTTSSPIHSTTALETTTTKNENGMTTGTTVSAEEANRIYGVGIVEAVTPVKMPIDITNGHCTTGIPNPTDGTVVYSQNEISGPYAAGTIATLKCQNGYSAHGETSICHEGQWYPPIFSPCTRDTPPTGAEADELPECISGVVNPLNGNIRYSNAQVNGPFPVGTIATVACNEGYVPVGSTALTCQSGAWLPATPAQCMPENGARLGSGGVTTGSCLTGLPLPLNGRVDYSNLMTVGPFPTGTAGTLICNTGYEPSGAATAVCQNGLWSPSILGECVLAASGGLGPGAVGTNSCVVGLVAPLNGVVSYSSGIFPPFPAGTIATVMCHLGYSVSGTPTSTCTNGAWYPPTTARCVLGIGGDGSGAAGQCTAIAGPLNGEIIYFPLSLTTTYNSGTTATLACNLGYITSGQITTTCMNGIWEPAFTGTCAPGLGGGGTTTTQCLFALPPVLNGNIQYSTGSSVGPYNEGTSATLTCSPGYLSSGTTTAICTNGIWNPTVLGVCTYSDHAQDVIHRGQCRHIFHVKEGQIHYSRKAQNGYHRAGTLAGLQCHKTGPLSSVFSICRNGQWTPPLGSCKQESDIDEPQITLNCGQYLAMKRIKILLLSFVLISVLQLT